MIVHIGQCVVCCRSRCVLLKTKTKQSFNLFVKFFNSHILFKTESYVVCYKLCTCLTAVRLKGGKKGGGN